MDDTIIRLRAIRNSVLLTLWTGGVLVALPSFVTLSAFVLSGMVTLSFLIGHRKELLCYWFGHKWVRQPITYEGVWSQCSRCGEWSGNCYHGLD